MHTHAHIRYCFTSEVQAKRKGSELHIIGFLQIYWDTVHIVRIPADSLRHPESSDIYAGRWRGRGLGYA